MGSTGCEGTYEHDYSQQAELHILTLAAAASESEPCPTFLTPSVPNWARTLCGASFRATAESAGPRSFLQIDTASSPISSMATTGPEDTNCTRLLQNGGNDGIIHMSGIPTSSGSAV